VPRGRKADHEGRALAGLAVDPDHSRVIADDAVNEAQPEPRPHAWRTCRPEGVENVFEVLRGNTDPGIADFDGYACPFPTGADKESSLGPGFHRLTGVHDDIQDRL